MMHRLWRLGLIVVVILITASVGVPQTLSSEDRERLFHERASRLRQLIQPGWTQEAVAELMGPPEVTGQRFDGPDLVETWWYHGYHLGIEFRNGVVSRWFFRFMR
jgi:hypothetical protein